MKTLQFLKKWTVSSCIYYTGLSVFFILLRLVIGASGNAMIRVSSFLLFLPCSFCLSAAGIFLSNKRVARWIRVLSHYAVTLLCVILFLWLPANVGARGTTVLILFVVFSLVYWLLFGVVHLFRGRIRRLLDETKG